MQNVRSLVNLASFVCVIAGCLVLTAPSVAQDTKDQRTSLTMQQLMQELENYGKWFTLEEWGWAWQPYDIVPWWVPYTHGEWQCTKDGPYWQSYKPYGWAVFHYGRWMLAEGRGWVWIPDTQWGPGFVCWRYGKGYLGWAPMPPEKPGDVGIAQGECSVPAAGWSFIVANHAFSQNVEPWIVPRARGVNLVSVTTSKTNYERGGLGWIDRSIPPKVMKGFTGQDDPMRPIQIVLSPQFGAVPAQSKNAVVSTYAPMITGEAPSTDQPFPSKRKPPPANPNNSNDPETQHPGYIHAINADALRLAHEQLMLHQQIANTRLRMMHGQDLQAPPWREFPTEELPNWQSRELKEQAEQDAAQRHWVDQRFLKGWPKTENTPVLPPADEGLPDKSK